MEEKQNKKCFLKKHEEINATSYCTECEKFMCKKCELFHSEFFDSKHDSFLISSNNFRNINNLKDKEENKIDQKIIEENIKYLKEFSEDLNKFNNKLKNDLKIIDKKKDDFQIIIQKIFTKIRNELNEVEDEYFMEFENKYENLNLNKKIKENEILLNKINAILKDGRIKDELLINECKRINLENEKLKNYDKLFDIEIPEEKNINDVVEKIKSLHIIKDNIFDSTIIKNDLRKQNAINNWIKEKMNKNIIKYELIYKLTKNGSSSLDFHKCCDNKGPTLTIIETKNNDIFGGFTPLSWNTNGNNHDKSKKTFLFSLNLMKKYDMFNREKNAIICYKSYGPTFGDGPETYGTYYDITFNENLMEGIIYVNKSNFFEYQQLELTQGKGEYETFDTKEIEIFKVIYE